MEAKKKKRPPGEGTSQKPIKAAAKPLPALYLGMEDGGYVVCLRTGTADAHKADLILQVMTHLTSLGKDLQDLIAKPESHA